MNRRNFFGCFVGASAAVPVIAFATATPASAAPPHSTPTEEDIEIVHAAYAKIGCIKPGQRVNQHDLGLALFHLKGLRSEYETFGGVNPSAMSVALSYRLWPLWYSSTRLAPPPIAWVGPEPSYIEGVYVCHEADRERLESMLERGTLPAPNCPIPVSQLIGNPPVRRH